MIVTLFQNRMFNTKIMMANNSKVKCDNPAQSTGLSLCISSSSWKPSPIVTDRLSPKPETRLC
jgi:hypothetical protein